MANNQAIGEELSQSARLLFNASANNWYGAVGLELLAGLLAGVLGLLNMSGDWALTAAVASTIPLVISYILRLKFEDQYDLAETMRRQSVLSEGLDWPVEARQLTEWRRQVGKQIRARVKTNPRSPDYYASQKSPGAERLAEMTIESAFYTRFLYLKLRSVIWFLFAGAIILAVTAIVITLTQAVPDRVDLLVARFLFSAVPIIISINLFGWGLRLTRLILAISEVEADLERLCKAGNANEPQVMRLVAEYNCQVVGGIPIHNRVFSLWGKEIQELWKAR